MVCGWYVGTDVSKARLDACALGPGGRREERSFENGPKGVAALLAWAAGLGEVAALGMESTGGYELGLALAACEAGLPVSVENPRRVRDLARAMGFLNKTDRADARAIAEYLLRVGPSPWRLSDPAVRELCLLTRHREWLLGELGRVRNRLGHRERLPALAASHLEARAAGLEREIREVDEARERLVGADAALAREAGALERIPGVGRATALLVLAEAGDVGAYPDAQSYAAAAGLSPCRRESGAWRGRTGISRAGNARLRKGLYMAASVASRHHPLVREFRDRLLAAGKTRMQALVACMRKLLMICYGVLRRLRDGKEPYYGKNPALGT